MRPKAKASKDKKIIKKLSRLFIYTFALLGYF